MESAYHLNEREAAELIGISPKSLMRYRRSGIGPSFMELPTQRPRYSAADVKQWIENQIRAGTRQDLRNGGIATKKNLHKGGLVDVPVEDSLQEKNEFARTFLE